MSLLPFLGADVMPGIAFPRSFKCYRGSLGPRFPTRPSKVHRCHLPRGTVRCYDDLRPSCACSTAAQTTASQTHMKNDGIKAVILALSDDSPYLTGIRKRYFPGKQKVSAAERLAYPM